MGSLLSTPEQNALDLRIFNVLLGLFNRPDILPAIINMNVIQDFPGALRFSRIIGTLGITVSHSSSYNVKLS